MVDIFSGNSVKVEPNGLRFSVRLNRAIRYTVLADTADDAVEKIRHAYYERGQLSHIGVPWEGDGFEMTDFFSEALFEREIEPEEEDLSAEVTP